MSHSCHPETGWGYTRSLGLFEIPSTPACLQMPSNKHTAHSAQHSCLSQTFFSMLFASQQAHSSNSTVALLNQSEALACNREILACVRNRFCLPQLFMERELMVFLGASMFCAVNQ